MTPLRQRFVEDLKIRRFAPQTQCNYVRCIEHYAEFFGKDAPPPARATVEVSRLPKGGLVEIDCVARIR